jgi:hypothetical protein
VGSLSGRRALDSHGARWRIGERRVGTTRWTLVGARVRVTNGLDRANGSDPQGRKEF